MRDLVSPLLEAIADGQPVAVCRLLETRGSTPQKAGATMLVFPNGLQAGTLGGGCVEADVRRQALVALASGSATLAQFQLDDDYGWDDGLICGGRMLVLIDPIVDASIANAQRSEVVDYYRALGELAQSGVGATEAIAVDNTSGLPATAQLIFDASGAIRQSLRVSADEATVAAAIAAIRRDLQQLAERPRPTMRHGVAFLPHLPFCRLVVVGGGHVGQAVAKLAADLEFAVTVVDDRPEYVSPERFPRAEQRLAGRMSELLPRLEIGSDTYCVIVTRGHNHDEEALFHLASRGAAYVGMIGSRRKIRLIFDDLEQLGVSADTLSRVHAPIGLDIGSQTVTEIAVSIAAELVAHRNQSLRRRPDLPLRNG